MAPVPLDPARLSVASWRFAERLFAAAPDVERYAAMEPDAREPATFQILVTVASPTGDVRDADAIEDELTSPYGTGTVTTIVKRNRGPRRWPGRLPALVFEVGAPLRAALPMPHGVRPAARDAACRA